MPARSNEFQKLIALLHRQVAAPETTVKESDCITDPATGELREVDVLIEHTVAGYTARIAVECRDRSRAATIQWIDELIGKYQNTGVKVVAVSKRASGGCRRNAADPATCRYRRCGGLATGRGSRCPGSDQLAPAGPSSGSASRHC